MPSKSRRSFDRADARPPRDGKRTARAKARTVTRRQERATKRAMRSS